MLDVQYRMHPAISHFPSMEFYNLSLQDGTVDAVGNVPARLLPPSSQHLPVDEQTGNRPAVIFLDHAGKESMKDKSRVNMNEGHIVASVVEDLLLHNPVSLYLLSVFLAKTLIPPPIVLSNSWGQKLASSPHTSPRFHC